MSILEYKCPSCGGGVRFDSAQQKLKCPYCDTSFEVNDLKEYNKHLSEGKQESMEWDEAEGSQWQPGEEEGMGLYLCKSCAGEIIADKYLGATECPYCGNPIVLTQQFSGNLRPDLIIPFKLDKETAKEKLIKHMKGKPLLPKVFKSENHIDEIKGVYVPFWLFDADTDADISYRATRVHSWSDSRYDYTETSHFLVLRGGSLGFSNVPVDGSTKIADDMMESIEPYDMSAGVDFQTAYLAGFLADKYDRDSQASVERANQRIRNSTDAAFRDTVQGYTTVTTERSNIRLKNGEIRYALLPVWLLNTSWKDKRYYFAMNGQTGKFVGDLPTNWKAFWLWLLGLFGGLGLVFSLIAYFI